ncbi:P-loop containing nucleoside triphosphate hydrolase protein [Pseudovirgaria hyperparasitica]|uniref:Signal recognition particle receptor subunit beta n=1 Tax=Pseudovirgaria hyperparasitica TaxID=470096 RepID=A0A6A6WLW8_9PEZI|nr:P-loop containing nucleoside triphosphate hydrolase protein [Pseudovirgaria hyperparasitica]KAF2763195.1 P-loop containing nucleoside triphosphate hydrolase protein [Pseudovirgaria hyperparasitica]
MAWHDQDSWLTWVFSPSISAIIVTALIALLLPVLIHTILYRTQAQASTASFLLLGPSGAGKTSLLTLLERGSTSATHTSQTPSSAEITLPSTIKSASNEYRSENDSSFSGAQRFILTDTPGHGKLRQFASDKLDAKTLKGIIFVVDAANLSKESGGRAEEGLTEAAEYLHDVLLALQKRYTSAKTSKGPKELPVLIAANKFDLFTALPEKLVKTELEKEITNVRNTKSKGLLDSGIGTSDDAVEEEKEWLGDGGEGKFEFRQMEEVNVFVDVIGGNVTGADGPGVGKWWEWIAKQI